MWHKIPLRQMQWVIIILGLLILPIPAAMADKDSPPKSPSMASPKNGGGNLGGCWTLSTDLGGRVNPNGLSVVEGIRYRNVYRYSHQYDMESAYWQTGLAIGVSPAYGQAGIHFEWMPWIFLSLRLQYNYFQFFGNSGSLLSFSSASEPFGDDAVKDRRDEEFATGDRFLFQPTLQGKVGPLILRNESDFAYYRFSGRGPYFLEQEYYTLLKDGDYLISNRTQLLYPAWKKPGGAILLTGLYYEVTRAYDAWITQQKIGGIFYWVPVASFWGLNRPWVGIKGGYHLQDPNRQGQFFVGAGMGFDLDL
jgi:hypothetical protein